MKRAHNEPGQAEAVIVASPKSFRMLLKQHGIMVLGIIILLLIIGGVGWKWATRNTVPPSLRVTTSDTENVDNQASAIAKESGLQAALSYYNQEVSYAINNDVKAELYLQASNLADSDNDLNAALQYGLKADAILHSASTSANVASVYQQLGDKTQAIKYYDIAGSEVKANQLAGDSKQYYLDEAKAVNGGTQ
jgi:tetratricopeptide (TPR) repeat protein